jgi:hypothetical protein
MKTTVAGVALLVALAAAGCGGNELEWKEVTSPDGGFKVLMPPGASKQNADEEPPLGKITLTTYTVKQKGDGYFLGWADLPPKPPFDPEDFLKGVAKRYDNAEKKSSKAITFRDNPGLEFELETPKGRKIVGRLYVVKNRLYELIVIGDGSRPPASAEAQKFFGSFQLLDPLMK